MSRTVIDLTVAASWHLPGAVQDPATTAVGDHAVLLGGLDRADVSVAGVIAARARGAATLATLPQALHDAAAAALGDTAYLFGGGEPSRDQILAVDARGQARQVGRLPQPASDVAAAALGGTVYVVGGYTGIQPLSTIVAWSPGAGAQVVGKLPHPVRYAAVAAVGSELIIAGGTSGTSATREVYAFDPSTRRLRQIAMLPRALTHATGAALHGVMYVIGGRGGSQGSQTRSILAIDPASGKVRSAGRLPEPVSDAGAAVLGSAVLVAGGRGADGTVSDTVYELRPVQVVAPAAVQGVAYRVPPLLDPHNVYAADQAGEFSSVVRGDRSLVYVPNTASASVDEIDPSTYRVIRQFAVGLVPQHVVPSYDLRTLWVTNDESNSLTPINPRDGVPGKPIPVEDPYNLYFSPDGRYALVMAERMRRIDFRDAHTLALRHSLSVPQCAGVNHGDFTADGRDMLVSCEFGAAMVVVDVPAQRVIKTIPMRSGSSPQDVKLSPDGRIFYVADLTYGGVWEISATSFRVVGFLRTGAGAHGLYPSRNAQDLYVSNRSAGSISVISFSTRRVIATWSIPGSSPDMGGVSADGRILWLSGRHDAAVYAIDTGTGRLIRRIPVGLSPHGICVFPQPGRYSLGHTGVYR